MVVRGGPCLHPESVIVKLSQQSVSRSADLLQWPLTVQSDSSLYFSLDREQEQETRYKIQDKNISKDTSPPLLSYTLNIELVHQPEMFADLTNEAPACNEPVISDQSSD